MDKRKQIQNWYDAWHWSQMVKYAPSGGRRFHLSGNQKQIHPPTLG